MIMYPYLAAFILTDDIFSAYGGDTNATPYDLRQAAYQIAESAVYYDLETPLQLTVFTGTYAYSSRFLVDHAYVDSVIVTRFLDAKEAVYRTVSGTSNYEVSLVSPELGLVSVEPTAYLSCLTDRIVPTKVQVVYKAGLSSGTSYDPRILLALTKYAMIQINEMVGFGNESTGDVGVKNYSNQEYDEERVALLRTGYGTSSQANFIHNILSPFRKRRVVGW